MRTRHKPHQPPRSRARTLAVLAALLSGLALPACEEEGVGDDASVGSDGGTGGMLGGSTGGTLGGSTGGMLGGSTGGMLGGSTGGMLGGSTGGMLGGSTGGADAGR